MWFELNRQSHLLHERLASPSCHASRPYRRRTCHAPIPLVGLDLGSPDSDCIASYGSALHSRSATRRESLSMADHLFLRRLDHLAHRPGLAPASPGFGAVFGAHVAA